MIKDFEIKKSVKTQDIIQNFKTKKGNRIYVVHQRNSTLFLDDHLDKITSINKTLKGFKNIQSYLKRLNIEIIEEEYPTAVAIEGLSDYPVIRPKKRANILCLISTLPKKISSLSSNSKKKVCAFIILPKKWALHWELPKSYSSFSMQKQIQKPSFFLKNTGKISIYNLLIMGLCKSHFISWKV